MQTLTRFLNLSMAYLFFISYSYDLNQYTNWLLAGDQFILFRTKYTLIQVFPSWHVSTLTHTPLICIPFFETIPSHLSSSNSVETCALMSRYTLGFLTTCFGNLANIPHCLFHLMILRVYCLLSTAWLQIEIESRSHFSLVGQPFYFWACTIITWL